MSASMVNRALSNIRTEIDFLRESGVISDDVYRQIDHLLPQKYDPANNNNNSNSNTAARVQSQSQPQPQSNQGILEYVEAIYDFEPQQDGDLRLRVGDKIQVLEKPSPEWYKGRSNGVVGMFPSNYVKVIAGTGPSQQQIPPPPMYGSDSTQGSKHSLFHHHQHNQQQQQQQQQPVYYQPPPGVPQQLQPQQPQQPQQIVVQQEQPQRNKHEGLKRFGKQLGNAAIFGAGATIGSDLVNSIF